MILALLLQAGYSVLVPYNVLRYDIAFDDCGQLKRVQVKTGNLVKGAVTFRPYSAPPNGKRRYYTSDEVDYYGVWCSELDQGYLVPLAGGGERCCSLRVDPTKNGQEKGIRWARDFEISPL